jgi:predicted nuclease with TOPRIM domain
MYKRLQDYNTSLQQYNGKLHTDLSTVENELKHVEKEKATIVESLSMLRGQLTMSRVSFYFPVDHFPLHQIFTLWRIDELYFNFCTC